MIRRIRLTRGGVAFDPDNTPPSKGGKRVNGRAFRSMTLSDAGCYAGPYKNLFETLEHCRRGLSCTSPYPWDWGPARLCRALPFVKNRKGRGTPCTTDRGSCRSGEDIAPRRGIRARLSRKPGEPQRGLVNESCRETSPSGPTDYPTAAHRDARATAAIDRSCTLLSCTCTVIATARARAMSRWASQGSPWVPRKDSAEARPMSAAHHSLSS